MESSTSNRSILLGLIAKLLCLCGTVAFQLVLHKSPHNIGLLVAVLGTLFAFAGSLMPQQRLGWLWCWLFWALQQAAMFAGQGPTLFRLASRGHGKHSELAVATASISMAWFYFVPEAARSEIASMLAVLWMLGLTLFGLNDPLSDLEFVVASCGYIVLNAVSEATLSAIARRGNSDATEFASVVQAFWILFVPLNLFTSIVGLAQLFLSGVLYLAMAQRGPPDHDD